MGLSRAVMREIPYLVAVFTLVLLSGLSLLSLAAPSGHDAVYYFPRHVEFQRALADGVLIPRWAPDFSLGYGQPLFNFTPPLFYYVTAGFRSLGMGLAAAGSMAAFLLLAAAGFSMYLLAREYFGRASGLLAAAAYLFAPYLLVTLYVRYAMGDFAAFAFVPLALWGGTRLARRPEARSLLIGAGGTALLLLSSNHVALMTLPAVALGVVVAALMKRSWRSAARGLACVLLGLGLSAFFWVPALAEREYVYIGRAVKGPYEYLHHFVFPHQLLYSPWGYGGSVSGPDDGLSLALGLPQLLLAAAAVAAVLIGRRGSASARAAVAVAVLVLLGAAFLTTQASAALWNAVSLLPYLQFPWRLLSLGTVAIAFLCGAAGLPVTGRALRTAVLAGVVMILVLQGFPNARPGGPPDGVDETLTAENVAQWGLVGTNANEFEPIWVQRSPTEPAPEPLTVLSGTAEWRALRVTSTVREFSADARTAARLRLNTSFFPGWVATIDRAPAELTYGNPVAAVEVAVERGSHSLRFEFTDTEVRSWAGRVSLASVLLLVLASLAARSVRSDRRT